MRHRLLRSRRLIAIVIAMACLSAGAHTTAATFSASTRNSNLIGSGTVNLSDNDSGSSVFNLTGLKPNEGGEGCITVTYNGSLSTNVRLYGTSSGNLPSSLNVVVTRGTIASPSFASCTNFVPDTSVYVAGQPPGVMWAGALSTLPSTYASGLVDPTSASPTTWSAGTKATYRISATVADDSTSNNKTASATFTWEAQA